MQHVEAFFSAVERDVALRNEVQAIRPGPEAIAAVQKIAAAHGHSFTTDEFTQFAKRFGSGGGLSDAELDRVSGGVAVAEYSVLLGIIIRSFLP